MNTLTLCLLLITLLSLPLAISWLTLYLSYCRSLLCFYDNSYYSLTLRCSLQLPLLIYFSYSYATHPNSQPLMPALYPLIYTISSLSHSLSPFSLWLLPFSLANANFLPPIRSFLSLSLSYLWFSTFLSRLISVSFPQSTSLPFSISLLLFFLAFPHFFTLMSYFTKLFLLSPTLQLLFHTTSSHTFLRFITYSLTVTHAVIS